MRSATSTRPLIWTLTAVIGSALIGCAASAEPTDPTAPANANPSAPSSTSDSADNANTPTAFNASFADAGADSRNSDATKDPTPTGGSAQCIDTNDAGPSELSAKKLADTDDCDTAYKEIDGIANGGVDEDFYSIAATDKGVSFSHPLGCDIDADFQDETAGTEMCVYMKCMNGTAEADAVTGCDQGTMSTNDVGMNGCCAAAPGRAVPKWNCSGTNDSVNIMITVKQSNNGEQCLPYKLSYKF